MAVEDPLHSLLDYERFSSAVTELILSYESVTYESLRTNELYYEWLWINWRMNSPFITRISGWMCIYLTKSLTFEGRLQDTITCSATHLRELVTSWRSDRDLSASKAWQCATSCRAGPRQLFSKNWNAFMSQPGFLVMIARRSNILFTFLFQNEGHLHWRFYKWFLDNFRFCFLLWPAMMLLQRPP
jgi:hypothetical protein